MNTMQLTFKRAVKLALAAVLTALIMAPTSALADTAAGTKITNTATVTWAGDAVGKSATAEVTVLTKEAAPIIAYVETAPSDAAITTAGVAESTSVTVTYSATSSANGVDTYDLAWSAAADLTNIANPDYDASNISSVELGGSVILSEASGTYTIPGVLGDHGLENGDTVIVGADTTLFTIADLAVVSGNTTFTLNGTPSVISAGTPIYEQKEFNLTLTTGTLEAAASGAADHVMTLAGSPDGASGLSDSVTSPTIYVKAADINITKTATGGAKPGDTITYEIVVANDGTADIASVVITDPIPNFTDYNGTVVEDVCTATFSKTATPTTFTYTPAGTPDADVAAVKFECDTLSGGAAVTVGFDVIIE